MEGDDFGSPVAGVSLRDWFATFAMAAGRINKGLHTHRTDAEYALCRADTARAAYAMADAMIEARKNGGERE